MKNEELSLDRKQRTVFLSAHQGDISANSGSWLGSARFSYRDELLLEREDFRVQLAEDLRWRMQSSVLLNRRYAWRGYKFAHDDGDSVSDEITLQACQKDTVFGTLTVRFDSSFGLAADELYHEEIDAYRRAGARPCELTRLAIEPEHGSKEVLGALFHVAYIYGALLRHATDVFIEVNPRHVAFYKRMLSFTEAGPCRICDRVDAPAILLHLDVTYVAEQISRLGGSKHAGDRSLYAFFLSKHQEERIYRRLRGTDWLTDA